MKEGGLIQPIEPNLPPLTFCGGTCDARACVAMGGKRKEEGGGGKKLVKNRDAAAIVLEQIRFHENWDSDSYILGYT